MPSSAANGPHGFGTVHTCSIGVLPAFDVPGGHAPSRRRDPGDDLLLRVVGEAEVAVHVPLRERAADVGHVGEGAPERQLVHRRDRGLLPVADLVHDRLGSHRVEDVTVVGVRPVHVVLVAGDARRRSSGIPRRRPRPVFGSA